MQSSLDEVRLRVLKPAPAAATDVDSRASTATAASPSERFRVTSRRTGRWELQFPPFFHLSKTLTLAELLLVAISETREVYPERRSELNTYLAIISDLAVFYGGSVS